MRDSAIRHLAVSDESEIVAAGFFEKTVQIWSWKTGEQIGEFQTLLDFGMRKLALSPDGKRCIVGRWGPKSGGLRGLAAYSVPDGRLLWNRKQIKHIANIRMSGSGQEIYCGVQDSSAYIIDAATGEIRSRVRGAAEIVGSRYSQHRLIVPKQSKVVMECRLITSKVYSNYPNYLMRGPTEFEIHPLSFGLHDAVFSPDAICLSEPTNALHPREEIGGVRLIDLENGAARWHIDLGSNHLAFNSSDGSFYCVAVLHDPRNRSLVRLADTILDCDRVALLGACWEAAFSPSGRVLVTARGDVYETSTGDLLMHLEFPQRDYPDS
jgi:WD40 repeat protein